jgi:hypothetical protein
MGHLPSDRQGYFTHVDVRWFDAYPQAHLYWWCRSVICAPAIVRAESLMPIRALIVPMQPVHAGFVERLRFHCMEQLLKNGWTAERATTFGGISENEARRQVAYARMQGLLA